MDRDVLDVEDAAALLRVRPATVLGQARAGRLPGRKVGRAWRFSRQALLDWLAGDVDTEPLSDADWQAVHEGMKAGEDGDAISLDELDQLIEARMRQSAAL